MNRSVAVVLGLVLACVRIGPASAQTTSYVGTVVQQGKPVKEATVWLLFHQFEILGAERAKPIETKSDAQGKFRLSGPKEGMKVLVDLFARANDGSIGWRSMNRRSEEEDSDLKIELLPVAKAAGRLTDAAGAPIVTAGIKVKYLNVRKDESFRQHRITSELMKYFEATTKDDGTFVLPAIPLGAQVMAEVSAPGYGNPGISWDQGQVAEFKLEKAGRLRIRFQGADDVKKIAGLRLSVLVEWSVLVRGPAGARKSLLWVDGHKDVTAIGAETLEVDDVLTGEGSLGFSAAPEAAYFPSSLPKFVIKSGELTEVTVTLQPAARVRGKVLNQETRRGVKGANVDIQSQDKQGKHLGWTSTMTGADGAFAAYVMPGKVSVNLGSAPPGYLSPREGRKRDAPEPVVLAGGAEHVFPDFLLEPATPLEGTVVDDRGKPVPGVIIHSAVWDPNLNATDPRTDDKGRFVLRMLTAQDVTALRARTPHAVTDGGVPVNLATVKGPVKLVVSEKYASRLKGRVTDGAGKAIVDAIVHVVWQCRGVGRFADSGISLRLESHRTDADGRFQTTALWPGDRYEVEVSADGYSKNQAVVLKAKAGKIHDVGSITLVGIGGKVAGVVVDSAGKPVAGVTVFNRGDAPKLLSTTSGADGRFKLNGFLNGPYYVFARKTGYRFTMKHMEGSVTDARITLLRSDEPPPAAEQPIRTPEHIAAERKLANYVIDKVLAMPEPATGGYQSFVFGHLVRTDLPRAKKWLAANKPKAAADSSYALAVRRADIKHVAADDADEALTLVAPLKASNAIPILLQLGERFAKSDPARGLRFTEEAVVRVRTVDPTKQASYLAQAGDLVMRLGRQAAGKKLLEEAAISVEKLGTDERTGYYRATVASLIGIHDLPRARALIKPLTKEETNRFFGTLATRLARTDSKTALALVDEMKADNSYYRTHTQLAIARKVAERDPAEAVRLVEAIADTRYQAEAFTHLAVIVAPRDRKLAWSLIDRSFAVYLGPDTFRGGVSRAGDSVFAAWTACQAQTIGYPDMASVVAHALACRPTYKGVSSPALKLEILVRMAKVLALVDPATARQLLDGVAPQSKLLGTGHGGFQHQDWLVARCLADPARGTALVDEAIAELAQQKDRLDFYRSGLMQLADVLTTPSAERVRTVLGLSSILTFRDDED